MQNSRQWQPDPQVAVKSQIAEFSRRLIKNGEVNFSDELDYESLQKWSTQEVEKFWAALADFYEIKFKTVPSDILAGSDMLNAKWFTGATLNFADHIFGHANSGSTAIIIETESGETTRYSYAQLKQDIAAFAAYLREQRVTIGDRVVGYLPNSYLGVVAFLASASIGAVWSQVGLDYNATAAADRLSQLEPKVLVTTDGYPFRGIAHDRTTEVKELIKLIPSLESVVYENVNWSEIQQKFHDAELQMVPVDFSHPLWVLYSSGTTGKPKGIVNSHGGALLEQYKTLGLHTDLHAEETFFWYTTPNWMMWNVQVSGLLVGSTIVFYLGDPLFPNASRLWDLVREHRVAVFGTNPGLLGASAAAGLHPGPLPDLRMIPSTGSALPASANKWVRQELGEKVQVVSVSGGTDVVGAFVGSSPISPVCDGYLSGKALGVDLHSWNDKGDDIIGEVGELVVTKPMPSMPIYFWNDPQKIKLKGAYFSTYENVWRQGDWITIHENGTVSMHGRSDATLNRRGIRLGSAEIYAALASLPDITDSLIVGVERTDGSYWMPLFVVKSDSWNDETSPAAIKEAIAQRASKHHLPDEIIGTEAIPYTRTGKKMEVPIKRILQGGALADSVSLDVTDNPAAVKWFTKFAR